MAKLVAGVLLGTVSLTFLSCGPFETPVCISAYDLASQYGYDKAAADVKYKGKTLLISGTVESVRIDPHQVDLKSASLYLIRCSGQDFSSLRKGEDVTVRCKGDGTLAPVTVSSSCNSSTARCPAPTSSRRT